MPLDLTALLRSRIRDVPTAVAALALVEQAGAVPVGLSVLLELPHLGGRTRVGVAAPELEVHALLVG